MIKFLKYSTILLFSLLFSCENTDHSVQEIDNDKENVTPTDTVYNEPDVKNVTDTINYAHLFDTDAFCMFDADSLTPLSYCQDKEMTEAYYSFFHLDPDQYNGECYLVSIQKKVGKVMPVIIACDDAPFGEEGWIYTIDKNYHIIDSLLIFEYEGPSGTDDLSYVSKESQAIVNNYAIKVIEINSLIFRDIDTTLTVDTTILESKIHKNGNITSENTFYQKYNEPITENPDQCVNYYVHTISENEYEWVKTIRIHDKIKIKGVRYKDEKCLFDFEISDYLINNKIDCTDVKINDPKVKDSNKEHWGLKISREGIVVYKNEVGNKGTLYTKSDYFSMPDEIGRDYYFMRN